MGPMLVMGPIVYDRLLAPVSHPMSATGRMSPIRLIPRGFYRSNVCRRYPRRNADTPTRRYASAAVTSS
jgi:hypothetical protein